jgi:hypothetical protein
VEPPAGGVSIFGLQSSDGRVERHIVDTGGDSPLTAEQALTMSVNAIRRLDQRRKMEGSRAGGLDRRAWYLPAGHDRAGSVRKIPPLSLNSPGRQPGAPAETM